MIARHLKPVLLDALQHFPVVTLLGSRQVGKSTLAQDLPSEAWPARYITLDDFAFLEAAHSDPDGFVDGLELPVILDEVQRAPELLRSVKRIVDRRRRPGLFLLTGSANLLTLRSVSESLAGRAAIFELSPFSWSELMQQKNPASSLDQLFEAKSAKAFIEILPSRKRDIKRSDFTSRVLAGGYPVPALMKSGRARTQWFSAYRQTYLERDLREVSNVMKLPEFGRLLIATAARTGKLLNTAELSRDLGIQLSTVRRYLGLLETTYQIRTVQPYYVNIGKRLVKTPKLYYIDTGLAASLLVLEDWETLERQGYAGAMIETWVAAELHKLARLCEKRTEIFFWRTHAGREVDFILRRGTRLAAIEVKWAKRITRTDMAGIDSCRQDLEGGLGLSVILYSGDDAFALNSRTAAIPLTLFF